MPLNTYESTNHPTRWQEGLVIGGSDVFQAPDAAVMRIEASGTASYISGGQVIALGANGSVVASRIATNIFAGSDLTVRLSTIQQAGSPYLEGTLVSQWVAETIITGGQWVNVSGAAGGASMRALAAATSTQGAFGVCVATTQSGGTPEILVQGCAFMTADTAMNNGIQFRAGAGAAINTVADHIAGSAARGVCLAGASSGGAALVYLW